MKNVNKRPLYHNYIRINDEIWFWDLIHNGLFICDEEGTINRVELGCYERYELEKGSLYGMIAKYEDKIILSPYYANEVLVYDVITKEEKYIYLDCVKEAKRGGNFLGIIIKEQYAYILGFYTSYVLKVNISEATLDECIDFYEGKEKQEEMPYYKFSVLCNDEIFIPTCLEAVVYTLNTETLEYKKEEFDEIRNFGFADVVLKDEIVWLAPARDDALVKWNYVERTKEYIYDFPENYFYKNKPGIGFMHMHDDKLFLLPLVPECILLFDTINEKVLVEPILKPIMEKVFEKGEGIKKYFFISEENGKLIFLNGKNRILYIYDYVNKDIKIKEVIYSEKEEKWWANRRFNKVFGKKVNIENKNNDLNKYLDMLGKI